MVSAIRFKSNSTLATPRIYETRLSEPPADVEALIQALKKRYRPADALRMQGKETLLSAQKNGRSAALVWLSPWGGFGIKTEGLLPENPHLIVDFLLKPNLSLRGAYIMAPEQALGAQHKAMEGFEAGGRYYLPTGWKMPIHADLLYRQALTLLTDAEARQP